MSPRSRLIATALLLADPAAARTMLVGQGREFSLPSQALAAAQTGDTVRIAPGEYFDCAVVQVDGLTIEGEGSEPAVLTDKVCEGKALLVLRGNGLTVRNLTLQRARVPDGNGAGIRLERPDLTVDRVRFINDQVGLLTGGSGGTVSVAGSVFERGGVGGERPKYAIMVGESDRLHVSDSRFAGLKGGLIATAARRSDVVGNTMAVGTGDPEEFPSYAVLATDGVLTAERNVITVGPLSPRGGATIGVWDEASATLRGNRMLNQTGQTLSLLQDWSSSDPVVQDNRVASTDSLVTTSGLWRHRAARQYYRRKEQARSVASAAKQFAKQMLGR